MNILFLTDNFPPEVNAPASRTFEHCREWVRAGHQVTVITCAPNFPTGKVFEGYNNRLFSREVVDGIRVIRVLTYITANEGLFKRIIDYVSFMISAILFSPFAGKADVVVGTSPQFFTACAAFVVASMRGKPFVFELRDIWPESVKAVGVLEDSAFIHFFTRLELYLYKKATAIVSVTHAFKMNLIRRGIEAEKIHVVTNGVDLTRFKPSSKDLSLEKTLGHEDKFVVGYIGTIGMAHALETLLDVAELCGKDEQTKDVRLVILGNGADRERLVEMAKVRRIENLRFIESVPKDEVTTYWAMLDVAVIHLKKTKLFESVIPSKLFECMGMGLPVIHAVAGESAEIVRESGNGLVAESENAHDIFDKIVQLKTDANLYQIVRQNGLSAAPRFDRKQLAGGMLDVLKGLGNSTRHHN